MNVLKESVKIMLIVIIVMDFMFVFVLMDGKDEIVKLVKYFIVIFNV